MSFSGSVSRWIDGVKAGCEDAATSLWRRYRMRLMVLARRKLRGTNTAMADEEDVAIAAFHSFLRRCSSGGYPDLSDRTDLWRLLIAITIHKANNQVRHQNRGRRDVRTAGQGEAVPRLERLYDCHQLMGPDPPPELISLANDALEKIFSKFSDGELRKMVLYKLDGYSNDEIAAKIGRSRATVERRFRMIRDVWRKEFDE